MNPFAPTTLESETHATLRGVDVTVEVSVDAAEIERRAEAGVAGRRIGGLRALGALLRLPESVPVDVSSLAGGDLDAVSRVTSAVDFPTPGMIRRVARPAVCPLLVSVCTGRWRDGLRLLGRFAPYSARRLVLLRVPDDIELLCMEADYWGVGVSLDSGDGVISLVDPAPFRAVCYTAAAWKFDEDLYAQL